MEKLPRFLSGREAAEMLNIGKTTLYLLAKDGKVPFVKIGNMMRFRSDELDRCFSNQQEAK